MAGLLETLPLGPLGALSGQFVIDWVQLIFIENGGLTMPTLVPSVWTTGTSSVPYVWNCSECEAAFDMGPMRGSTPSQKQIDNVNRQFKAHCRQVHPHLSAVNCLGDAPRGHLPIWRVFNSAQPLRRSVERHGVRARRQNSTVERAS